MARENIDLLVVKFTKAIGVKELCKDRELFNGRMEKNTKDNSKTGEEMAMVSLGPQTAKSYMKAHGKMV